jgi:AraC-like DNA-binding protein
MFHFDKNFGLFIGQLTDNKFHKHYALQISVASKSYMTLSVKNQSDNIGKAFFLNSKVEHKLICDTNQLTILINPLSTIGHQLYLDYRSSNHYTLNDNLSDELINVLNKIESREITFENLCILISQILTKYKCNCELDNHLQDDRIIKAFEFIDNNFEKVLSLEEVAEHCHLSPTRFLHLFKEKTNLNFRRYQLWNKVVKSLPYLIKNSITETAYTFGFSDSSHYTRTFIETFGVTPKFFLQRE